MELLPGCFVVVSPHPPSPIKNGGRKWAGDETSSWWKFRFPSYKIENGIGNTSEKKAADLSAFLLRQRSSKYDETPCIDEVEPRQVMFALKSVDYAFSDFKFRDFT